MTISISNTGKPAQVHIRQHDSATAQSTSKVSPEFEAAHAALEKLLSSRRAFFEETALSPLHLHQFLESVEQPGFELARLIEQFAPVEITSTAERDGLYSFNDAELCFLARTLTQRTHDNTAHSDICKITEREYLTLTNELSSKFSILVTPATLIKPDTPINLLSGKKGRPEWFGLPSILYAVPHTTGGGTRADPHANGQELSRSSVSHPQSYASNQLFTKDGNESGSLTEYQKFSTPHQSIQKIAELGKSRKLFKASDGGSTEPSTNLKQFRNTLGPWVQETNARNNRSRADHNEVGIRLWPWDVTHVTQAEIPEEASQDQKDLLESQQLQEALHAAIVIACKRHNLAAELLGMGKSLGTDHPLLQEFLEHQLSAEIPSHFDDQKSFLQEKLENCTNETKQKLAIDLVSKLLEKVSVVSYVPGQSGFEPARDVDRLMTADMYMSCRDVAKTYMLSQQGEDTNDQSIATKKKLVVRQYLKDMVDAALQDLRSCDNKLMLWPGVGLRNDSLEMPQGHYSLQNENFLQVARALIDRDHKQKIDVENYAALIDRVGRLVVQETTMLSNSLKHGDNKIDILITPGTLLKSELAIQTMSNPYTKKLERWKGNPVIIYAAPIYPDAKQSSDLNFAIRKHRWFSGHVQSIKSNQAFSSEYFSKQKEQRSKNQNINALTEVIEKNPDLHLKDSSWPVSRGAFQTSHQIASWGNERVDVSKTQSQGQSPSLPHNEVLTRLWPWDITQVCTGHHPTECHETEKSARLIEALSTANNLAVSRLSLAMEFCETAADKGIDHPVFLDYLSHQLSVSDLWTDTPGGNPNGRSLEVVKGLTHALNSEDKHAELDELIGQLARAVYVSQYEPGQSEFQPITENHINNIAPAAVKALNGQLRNSLENIQLSFNENS